MDLCCLSTKRFVKCLYYEATKKQDVEKFSEVKSKDYVVNPNGVDLYTQSRRTFECSNETYHRTLIYSVKYMLAPFTWNASR